MACDCVSKTLEELKVEAEKYFSNIPHVEGSVNSHWEQTAVIISNGDYCPLFAAIMTEYRPLKRDGTPAKNAKKFQDNMLFKYCPFCGEKHTGSDLGQ